MSGIDWASVIIFAVAGLLILGALVLTVWWEE